MDPLAELLEGLPPLTGKQPLLQVPEPLSEQALEFLNRLGPMDMGRWRWLVGTLPGVPGWPEQEIMDALVNSGILT